MEVEKGTEIELGRLEQLDLSHMHLEKFQLVCGSKSSHHYITTYVLKGIDALCRLLDFASNDFWDELGGELGKGAARGFAGHDLSHLLADGTDLR